MKNILILTDFSANAAHAALAGTMLAKHLHANIMLLNSNTSQALTPVYAGGPTVVDEINFMEEENKERLEKLAASLKPLLPQSGTNWQPTINYEERLGGLAYQVRNVADDEDVEMVVMGAREGSRMDHFLTGSETFSVIDHSTRPVLVMPYDTNLDNLKKVVFATDFAEADVKAVRYLVKLGAIFNYRLHLVHINLLGEDDITEELRKTEFMKHIHRLRYPNIEVEAIYGKDIINRLNRLCEESGSGLLAITHYKNSLFSRLFHQSVTRKALEKQKVPLLVFPAKFEG